MHLWIENKQLLKNDTVNEDKKFGPEKLNTKDSNKKTLSSYLHYAKVHESSTVFIVF